MLLCFKGIVMYKIYLSLIISIFIMFTGCSSQEPVAKEKVVTVFDSCVIEGVEAPRWVCGNETAQNIEQLHDVGSAKISKLGVGFTQREAAFEGRKKLQEQIEELAHEKIVLFMRETGLNEGEDINKAFVVLLSKRVALKVIEQSRVSEYWKNYYLNRAYAQVVVKKETFRQITQRKVLLEIREKSVYWENFKDTNASKVLEKVLSEI